MENNFVGCLLGLAVGDALGATVECMPAGSFDNVTGLRDGGKYNLIAGQFTDDTSLALCMGESIIDNNGEIDYDDFHTKFRNYYELGHLTSTGECFDIGKCTLQGMNRYKATKDVFSGGTEDYCSGNGSIMRLAPIPMFFALKDYKKGINACADSSKLTHGGRYAVDCCKLQGAITMKFLCGELSKEQLFSETDNYFKNLTDELSDKVKVLIPGNYANKTFPKDIVNSGFSVKALESALWAFYHTTDFESGVLKIVNMGDDADTVAAIYGQIAGAYYGINSINEDWINGIFFNNVIIAMAKDLYALANNKPVMHQELYSLFNEMEKQYHVIYRKCSPGPKMYLNTNQFDTDANNFKEQFSSTDKGKELLKYYEKILSKQRKVVESRTNRPKLF